MKKLTKEQLTKMAGEYAKMYPEAKSIMATEDGNFFFDKNAALNHKNTAKVKLYEIPLTGEAQATELEEKKKAEAKAEAEARVREMNLDNADEVDYNEARHLLAALDLEPESPKKDDVIAALKNVQTELKTENTED